MRYYQWENLPRRIADTRPSEGLAERLATFSKRMKNDKWLLSKLGRPVLKHTFYYLRAWFIEDGDMCRRYFPNTRFHHKDQDTVMDLITNAINRRKYLHTTSGIVEEVLSPSSVESKHLTVAAWLQAQTQEEKAHPNGLLDRLERIRCKPFVDKMVFSHYVEVRFKYTGLGSDDGRKFKELMESNLHRLSASKCRKFHDNQITLHTWY